MCREPWSSNKNATSLTRAAGAQEEPEIVSGSERIEGDGIRPTSCITRQSCIYRPAQKKSKRVNVALVVFSFPMSIVVPLDGDQVYPTMKDLNAGARVEGPIGRSWYRDAVRVVIEEENAKRWRKKNQSVRSSNVPPDRVSQSIYQGLRVLTRAE